MKNTTNTDNHTILLSNGRFVQSNFLDYIHWAVIERISLLQPLTTYTLKEICEDDFWSDLNPSEQQRAGWCMVNLVARGELPVISVNECRHEYPKKYRLK
jgi:hypothetical protein